MSKNKSAKWDEILLENVEKTGKSLLTIWLLVVYNIQNKMIGGEKMTNTQRDELLLNMDKRLVNMDKRLDNMDKRFDSIDKRFDSMDKRFDSIDKRLDGMDKRMDGMDKRFARMDKRMDKMDKRMDKMDKRMDNMEKSLAEQKDYTEKLSHSVAFIEKDHGDKLQVLLDIYPEIIKKFDLHDSEISSIKSDLESHVIRFLKIEKVVGIN